LQASSTEFAPAIKALQATAADALRKRAEAVSELQAAEQETLDIDTCYMAKLSAAGESLLSATTELATAKTKLSSSESALASACTELETKAAATAESAAMLSNKLSTVVLEVKKNTA
jgi:hypothetical protein